MIESNLLTQTAYRFEDWVFCNVGAYSYLVEEGFCSVSLMKHASGENHPWLWNHVISSNCQIHLPRKTSPQVQIKGTSGPSKRTDVFHKWKKTNTHVFLSCAAQSSASCGFSVTISVQGICSSPYLLLAVTLYVPASLRLIPSNSSTCCPVSKRSTLRVKYCVLNQVEGTLSKVS